MYYGFVESYDITTGRGTIDPCNGSEFVPFEVTPGTELIARTDETMGQRVNYDLAKRAVNVKPDIDPATIYVESNGARL
jgi:cold shock CspA family protein